jgi:pimeloyl-ACP methyl ester carboxylesterase
MAADTGDEMQPLFEHRLTLAGYETRALELEGTGPALVFLHGWADSADTWRRALALLGRRDRRALAVDLPGFGEADDLQEGPVLPQYDRFARALVEHCAADGAGRAVLVGNSMGGVVALRAAQYRDLPLAGVVPIAPAGLDMPRWFALVERDPIVRTLLDLPFPLPERLVRGAVGEVYRRLAFARPREAASEVVAAFTGHHRDRARIGGHLAIGRRLLPELAEPFELERIAHPLLLIWGRQDRMVFHHGAERVLKAVPGARYELLEGCGHCPQIEEAERVVELLEDFAPPVARAA